MFCKILNQKVKDWELFNLANDRTETINLAAEFPDKIKTMEAGWEKECKRSLSDFNFLTESNNLVVKS